MANDAARNIDELNCLRDFADARPRRMDTITHFQHITNSKDSYRQIQREGKLNAKPSPLPGWCPLAKRPDIKGVWFCSNLYQHDLPTVSPYGKHRVLVSIDSILSNMKNPKLYMESAHYSSEDDVSIQFVRFILTPGNFSNIPKGCLEVDKLNNPFLRLNKDKSEYSTLHNEYGLSKRDNIRVFVEVLVIGDVDLGVRYDMVRCSGKTSVDSKRGIVPEVAIVAGMANM